MSKLIKPESNFTQIGNSIFKNKKVTLKDIGLYCKLMHYPPTWNFSCAGLATQCRESKNTINKSLKNLEEYGYLERIPIRNTQGRIVDWNYQLYHEPHPKKRDMEKRDMEKQDLENEAQYNTIKSKTNRNNTVSLSKELFCDLKKTKNGIIDSNCKNCFIINVCPFSIETNWRSMFGTDFLGILLAMDHYFFSNKNYNFRERKYNRVLTSLEEEFDCLLDAEPKLLDTTYRRKAITEMREG